LLTFMNILVLPTNCLTFFSKKNRIERVVTCFPTHTSKSSDTNSDPLSQLVVDSFDKNISHQKKQLWPYFTLVAGTDGLNCNATLNLRIHSFYRQHLLFLKK
jgi:hypothetical protein